MIYICKNCKNENREGGECCGEVMERKCDGCGYPASECKCSNMK